MSSEEPKLPVLRARQLVSEAERRVTAQRDLIDEMNRDRDSRDAIRVAEEVLHAFENTLDTMRRYLRVVQNEQEGHK